MATDVDFDRAQLAARIRELQAQDLPVLTWTEVFTVPEGKVAPTPEQAAALDDYFAGFVKPFTNAAGETICCGCQRTFHSGLLDFGRDRTSYAWSLAHGEMHCTTCGYPARYYHYDLGGKGNDAIIQRLSVALPVHPKHLELVAETVDAR